MLEHTQWTPARCCSVITLCLVTTIVACSGDDITDPSQITFPTTGVSYAAQVAPYMTLSCNVTGCHDQARPGNAMVDLSSWIGVRANNVAVPYDTNSPLVLVMEAKVSHSGQFTSTENQREGVKQWVREGAQNN